MQASAELKLAGRDLASGQILAALNTIRRVRREFPPNSVSEEQIGSIFESIGWVSEALDAYRHAIDLDAENATACERLASLYENLQFHGRSAWYAARAARLRRFDRGSLIALARAQYRVGKVQSCLRTYRRALKLNPADSKVHSNFLFMLLHSASPSAAALKEAHEHWIDLHCEAPSQRFFANTRDPIRKLRLGYLSHEFHQSPDRHFLLPVIENHDHRNYEIYLFHTAPSSDFVTEEYKRCADVWRDLSTLTVEEMNEQIRLDEIDLLVDRSGHISSCQTVAVLQQRSAPVQVSYSDYPCTTGCAEVDYFVSDRWITPAAGFAAQHSERHLYQLPHGALLYAPPPSLPEFSELPHLKNGGPTFGLFQRPAKFNDNVWNTIGAILGQVGNARLLVQHADAELDEPGSAVRSGILNVLRQRGIAGERIEFVGAREGFSYFGTVGGVDIALDTFPYSGATTTCSCLWMGVPVVTLAGERYSSRVSASILSRIGLDDWVATSTEDYVAIATAKAADLPALAKLRASLRRRMSESSVCRPEIVVRELEEGYRWMWRQWCASQAKAMMAGSLG